MDEGKTWTMNGDRERPEPGEAFFTESGTGGGSDLADCVPKGRRGFGLGGKFLERLGADEHLVGVAEDAGPAEVADAVEDFNRTGAAVGEVASVINEVGRLIAQVREDSFEGGEVAVDVRKDGDAHRTGAS